MSKAPNIIYSQLYNPYTNLGIENWIFKNLITDEPILFLWQSSPAIIIGRAQNPWLECNLTEITKDNIPIVRRQSGGGTVFHDLGNINFTFLMPNKLYDKKKHLQTIIDALENISINAEINDRNDIITKIGNQPYKLSGSAYRETKHTSFHHGTLLIQSDLPALERYLHHKIDENITAKGVSSVRSKVTSIEQINSNAVSIKNIYAEIEKAFIKNYSVSQNEALKIDDSFISKNEEIKNYAASINNWDWTYSKTLPFEYKLQINANDYLTVNIKQGKIINFEHNIQKENLTYLTKFLKNQPTLNKHALENLNLSTYGDYEKNILKNIIHLFTT